MRQIVQHFNTGETAIIDAPAPTVGRQDVLVQTTTTLISAGTERMLVEFGRASMLTKARQQPERVKQVLEKIKTDGLINTIETVRSKLDQPVPLGYCNVGKVIAVGTDVQGISVGDRVASNGAHAEIVRVPHTLCARIPDSVSDEQAAFTVLASIGLQGARLAVPTMGEAFVVTGAGLIGLLLVQILLGHGCRVLAIDFDDAKLAIARSYGAETCNPSRGEDPVSAGMAFSRGRGVDAVIITASTTSNDPVTQAAQMSRKRGRIILVGVTGLELNRADFYEKELTFQVSCSYGPGRYDPSYEDQGQDYPFGFVRWTQGRNFEAILDMFQAGTLDASSLISQRYRFADAGDAYRDLSDDKSGLGRLLVYDDIAGTELRRTVALGNGDKIAGGDNNIGVIGAGNYASRMLIPAFKKAGAFLHTIASSGGLSGAITGRKAGFHLVTSDTASVFADPDISSVVIATRHDSHALLSQQALAAGKHVYVEKPLALTIAEVEQTQQVFDDAHRDGPGPQLMVGFNRRFAPHIVRMKELLDTVREPKSFLMVMNAGAIPRNHWTQDPAVGGGRIIGEACHFIDLMRFLAGSPIISVDGRRMGDTGQVDVVEDKASITLGFADGSFGTIMYLANGSSRFPKERIEAFTAGRVLQLDNFRVLTGYGWPGFSSMKLRGQDKGQNQAPVAFLKGIQSGTPAIPSEEIFEVARVTIELADRLRSN